MHVSSLVYVSDLTTKYSTRPRNAELEHNVRVWNLCVKTQQIFHPSKQLNDSSYFYYNHNESMNIKFVTYFM